MPENPLAQLEYEGHTVRGVMDVAGEPWFVAADIGAAVEHSDISKATAGYDADERGAKIVRTLGGPQEMTCLSEAGVYRFLATARVPKAKPFQRWLFREVLPSIFRTGRYEAPASKPASVKLELAVDREIRLRRQQDERERKRQAEGLKLAAKIAEGLGGDRTPFDVKRAEVLAGEPLADLKLLANRGRETEHFRQCAVIGAELGCSANMVGKVARELGLHGDELYWRELLEITPHGKEVLAPAYNQAAVEQIAPVVARVLASREDGARPRRITVKRAVEILREGA